MVRLFVSDIDGCLSEPYRAFDLETLKEIRNLVSAGSLSGKIPAFTICTGRPLGYAEAVAQMLGCRLPFLFEAGAGMYHPVSGVRTWHPDFGPSQAGAIAEIQRWLETRVAGTDLSVDRGKYTQAGLIGASHEDIERELEPVTRYVTDNFPEFWVAHTDISIDIMASNLTKREGLAWLGAELSVQPEEMAFIGDTNGDLGGLRWVGTSFAPDNATEQVKAAVDSVTRGAAARGVLEAYLQCAHIHVS